MEALGKNLLIRFDNGLEVRTHLRMHGSWHRYRPGERWKRARRLAPRLVIEVPGSVAVCFDAPVVELFEQRAEGLHPSLSKLGPDLLAGDFDADEALRRLRDPSRADLSIAEALVDQRAMAGVGNVYKSEVLFLERRVAVRPGRVGRRRDASAARRHEPPCAPAERRSPGAWTGARDDDRRPIGGRAAVRLRPRRSAVSPVRDAHPDAAAGRRAAADHVVVSALPAGPGVSDIDVRCELAGSDAWRCDVELAEAGVVVSRHSVRVSRPDLRRLAPDESEPDELVRRSFRFLLEREAPSMILRSFDLSDITRYFPEFEREVGRAD